MRPIFISIALLAMSGCGFMRNAPNAVPPPDSYQLTDDVIETGGVSQTAHGASITPAFFQALRNAPALGRRFLPDEYESRGTGVVIISYRFWQRSFGSDPAVIGKTVRLNRVSRTIVGIMPATFDVPAGVDLWIPKVSQ